MDTPTLQISLVYPNRFGVISWWLLEHKLATWHLPFQNESVSNDLDVMSNWSIQTKPCGWINWILSLGEDIGSTWEVYFWLPTHPDMQTPEHHEEGSTTNSIENYGALCIKENVCDIWNIESIWQRAYLNLTLQTCEHVYYHNVCTVYVYDRIMYIYIYTFRYNIHLLYHIVHIIYPYN